MSYQPGPAGRPDGHADGRRVGRRHPFLAALLAVAAAGGLVVAGLKITQAVMPRKFTSVQTRQIQAWELARRWRVTPRSALFPATFRYQLSGQALGSAESLTLTARRLAAPQEGPCEGAAVAGVGAGAGAAAGGGGEAAVTLALGRRDCQAVLRASYTDATGSLVMTVSMVVLAGQPGPAATVRPLVAGGSAAPPGSLAVRPLLRPVAVAGTLAASFGTPQRQLSWVEDFGPYLVVATVGYADGRPRVAVRSDSYEFTEMVSFAQGGASTVIGPLSAPVPVPACPGAPGC